MTSQRCCLYFQEFGCLHPWKSSSCTRQTATNIKNQMVTRKQWRSRLRAKATLGPQSFGDSDYVKGVVCLGKGLRKVQAAYPLVVGCLLREINPVIPPVGNEESPFSRAYFVINYCKLRLWKFVECEKMIYMDGDIQVLGFIDNLFDMPCGYFYAVMDCSCQMDGQRCAEALKWPKVVGEEPKYYFNGGMFLLAPCLHTHTRLLSTLAVKPPTTFAELDFLNFFFKGMSKRIHPDYNLLVTLAPSRVWFTSLLLVRIAMNVYWE